MIEAAFDAGGVHSESGYPSHPSCEINSKRCSEFVFEICGQMARESNGSSEPSRCVYVPFPGQRSIKTRTGFNDDNQPRIMHKRSQDYTSFLCSPSPTLLSNTFSIHYVSIIDRNVLLNLQICN